MELNYYVLAVFAPILIVVGVLGFVLPDHKSLTSVAPAYNIFHILFGLVGVTIVVLAPQTRAVRGFNIGFGLLDVYQAVASFAGLYPREIFKWKKADDVLHIVIGLGLVAVGVFAT